MKKWCSIIVVFAIMLFLLCMPAFADTEFEVTTDGWVKYTRLNVVQFSYKVNGDQNESYHTTTLENLKLPYGPNYVLLDPNPISEFWVTVSLNNYDFGTNTSTLAEIQPGETISISWRAKLWMAYRYEQNAFTPIDAGMYSCRIYLDGNYSKYLSPELSATAANGGSLYYNFTNNTDKPISLSRVSIGVFDGDNSYMDSYGYGFYLTGFQYRLFTNAQQAAQAVSDAIGQQTEDLKDSIQDQTDQITGSIGDLGDSIGSDIDGLGDSIGSDIDDLGDQIGGNIEQSTDQILNGWEGDATAPEGSESIGDLHDVESELLESTEDGISLLGDYLGDVEILFDTLFAAFGAVGELFEMLLGLDMFYFLVGSSLAIGLFSFLLGVGPSLVSRVGSKKGGGK